MSMNNEQANLLEKSNKKPQEEARDRKIEEMLKMIGDFSPDKLKNGTNPP